MAEHLAEVETPPFAGGEAAQLEPTPAELLQLLKADLLHVEKRAALARKRAEADDFLKLTELPEVLEELQLTIEEWQEELGEQLEGLRATEELEDTTAVLAGSGEPPPHEDKDAPPQLQEVPRG